MMFLRYVLTGIALLHLCAHATGQVVIADAAKLSIDETSPSVELVIDDTDGSFYATTGWTSGSFSGGYLNSYRYATQSSTSVALAYWHFDIPQSGNYRLALHYPTGANRSTAAQYRFQAADGLHEFSVDQTAGGDWSSVGTFALTTGSCVLQLSNRLSTAVVETLIVDDGDPLFSKMGYWTNGTVSECYLGDYLYAGCSAAQTATARWSLPVLSPGNYDVDVWYDPGANRSNDACYVLQHSGGITTRSVAQTGGEPGWHSLTPFHFDTGWYEVSLGNVGPPDRVVIADALRLRFCSDQGPLPPVIDHYADLITTPSAEQSFPVRANVWSISPVTTVTAWYAHSGGTTVTLSLYDDGAHGDGDAADGVYGGELPGEGACSVIRYGFEACNSDGGVGRTPEMKCLVACDDTTRPELRVAFMDTPKTPSDMDTRLAGVRSGNFNAVIPSVRDIANAYYQSSLEPMAVGVQPGYDPLADLITKAHETSSGQQRLQVHPLVLVYRVSTTELPPPGHVLNLHPEWTSEDYDGRQFVLNRLYLDQGIPEVQDYLVSVFMEVVRNYDIDGFNLDLIRYADQQLGYNPIALSWFHAFTGRTDRPPVNDVEWCGWRRQQVTALVRRMAALIRSEKPHVVLSADVICWDDPVMPVESNVFYKRVFQDWTGWMSKGYLDLALGMAYRDESNPAVSAQFDHWQEFLMNHAAGKRAVAIVGGYRNYLQHTLVQLHRLRESGADVLSLYSYNMPESQGSGPDVFQAAVSSQLFRSPVPPPVFDWKSQTSTGLVMGTARAGDGTPLRRVRIRLSPGLEERTDLCGFFAFFNCQPGTKVLELLTEAGNVVTSCSVTVAGGVAIRQDINLLTNAAESSWAGFR